MKFLNLVSALLIPVVVATGPKPPFIPKTIGMVVFPGISVLDVFGPLDALNLISLQRNLTLYVIADNLNPVASNDNPWMSLTTTSKFGQKIVPSHTYANAPDFDVLIVPGGLGTRAPGAALDTTIAFVKKRFPKVKYFISVCTGSGIAARAGVLDGKYATTNKKAWAQTTALGPKVRWIAEARWVVDGKIWTSSGVSAGIDVTMAWIAHVWGEALATWVANGSEYRRQLDSTYDPFAALYNMTNEKNSTNQGKGPKGPKMLFF